MVDEVITKRSLFVLTNTVELAGTSMELLNVSTLPDEAALIQLKPVPVNVKLLRVIVGMSCMLVLALENRGIITSSSVAGTPDGVQLDPVAQEPPEVLFQVLVAPFVFSAIKNSKRDKKVRDILDKMYTWFMVC